MLTEQVYSHSSERPSLPDQDGRLQLPAELHLCPEGLPDDALDAWTEFEGRPLDWCHRSVDTRERRSRAVRLLELNDRSAASIASWLEALVSIPSPTASAAATRTAAVIVGTGDDTAAKRVRISRILLAESGKLVQPLAGHVFLPSDYQALHDVEVVHADVMSIEGIGAALRQLSISPVDAALELDAVLGEGMRQWHLEGGIPRWPSSRWLALWKLVRAVDPDKASDLLRTHLRGDGNGAAQGRHYLGRNLHVLVRAGDYRELEDVLLPGPIVPADGSRDGDVTIDTEFHEPDMAVLRQLGAAEAPAEGQGSIEEEWFAAYRREAIEEYVGTFATEARHPRADYLSFDRDSFVGPLEPLLYLSEAGRALFTEALLRSLNEVDDWTLRHDTQADVYPPFSFTAPAVWLARREGRLRTSLGVRGVEECVASSLHTWSRVFPVADVSDGDAERLGLPTSLDAVPNDLWGSALEAAYRIDEDPVLGRLYAEAAAAGLPAPETVRCRVGQSHQDELPAHVTVVSAQGDLEALRVAGKPVLLVTPPTDLGALISRWGLQPGSSSVRTEIHHLAARPPLPLVDEYPGLRWHLDEDHQLAQLVRCTVLRLDRITDDGKISKAVPFHIGEDGTIYCIEELAPQDVLARVSGELSLDLDTDEIDELLGEREDEVRSRLIVEIRNAPTDAERLVASAGEEAIRRQLPQGLLDAIADRQGTITAAELGAAALAIYGVMSLRTFREDLAKRGLEPPTQWAGSHGTRRFVAELGFPQEYGGSRGANRESLLEVNGPLELPALHKYQQAIAEEVRDLLQAPRENRGIIALPTGAGKTRVAVQAIVDAVREDGFHGPVLWIAQSDELCEQAVQAWREVWEASGALHRLYVSRFWSTNDVAHLADGWQVVVATIQKLERYTADDKYRWLSDVGCVVIDEAHGSTTPGYTRVLEWLGLGRGRRTRPLLGLTATPYRGVSESETTQLVNRYGGRRLDSGVLGNDPYPALQQDGVLARVEHEILQGEAVDLEPDELESLNRLRNIPSTALERLGSNVRRNRALLASIVALPDDWPVLLFAASVEQAQIMAALLSLEGIPAAAVSADTDPGSRRHYVDAFRRGELRVLTNFGVLTQGFDAPSVRAVYVARPTYSPNLYQQMIGRGLRGPLNGGKDRCRIVNVADTFEQFEGRLAFHEFDHLWNA